MKMGGFRVLLCLMRRIYSDLLNYSEVGLGGTGISENVLKGRNMAIGIRYYKLLFEAICRTKIEKSTIRK